MDPAWTDQSGFYRFDNVPAGEHRLRAIRAGYKTEEKDVPSAVNGVSTVNFRLQKETYNVPAVKPISKGKVRINGKKLEIDYSGNGTYETFKVKGVAYSPTPINGWDYFTDQFAQRSFQYLKLLNVNTIRTYSGIDKKSLRLAEQNEIMIIVGFYVDTNYDLSYPSIREKLKDDFGRLVIELKDSPSVLLWNIGNEQNYTNGSNPYWYTLTQEMAVEAYKIEGEKYHPVCVNNGSIHNIGNAAFAADDASLTYIDLWASNMYQWDLTSEINVYRTKSSKPIVLTEWGIDALDNRIKKEYEDVQAQFDSTNWTQIISNSDVCAGGTVFEFTDEWWKAGDNLSHDYGGYATGSHPDGYSNEEWWGLIAVTPDANNDGMDDWRPRKVFYTLQQLWQ